MRRPLLLIILILLFIFIMIYNLIIVSPKEVIEIKKLNDSIYASFNYSFCGVVSDYYENRTRGNHYGVATLDLKYSDIAYYNPSDTSDTHFCLIKNKRARVLIPVNFELERIRGRSLSIQKGDTLLYNGILDKYTLYFGSDSSSWNSLTISINKTDRVRSIENLQRFLFD